MSQLREATHKIYGRTSRLEALPLKLPAASSGESSTRKEEAAIYRASNPRPKGRGMRRACVFKYVGARPAKQKAGPLMPLRPALTLLVQTRWLSQILTI